MQLMMKHNCSNLEQAFLELSEKQTTSTIGQKDENSVRICYSKINIFYESDQIFE